MDCQHKILHRGAHQISYRIYHCPERPKRAALFLHGAGVAGQFTWEHIVRQQRSWQTVVVPDLRGAGQTYGVGHVERPFSMADLLADMAALSQNLSLPEFDLAGYSFGGLLAMQLALKEPEQVGQLMLLEPVTLEQADWALSVKQIHHYRHLADGLKSGKNIRSFVEAFIGEVAPRQLNNPKALDAMVIRLAHRPIGFAHTLEALAEFVGSLDREAMLRQLPKGLLLSGANSPGALHKAHEYVGREFSWTVTQLVGTDHSLPYQKPRKIAEYLDAFCQG